MLRYIDTPIKYSERTLEKLKKEYKFLRIVYYSLNILTAILAATSTIVAALVISKLIWVSFPDWFFFLTTAITSGSALFTSILNFFTVKQNMLNREKQIVDIESELWLYNARASERYKAKDRDYMLFLRVASIADNQKAQEVYNYERNKQNI